MGKWGVDQDQTFIVSSGNLTTNFEDNTRLANVPYVIQAFVYIDYTKGSEDYLEVAVEESLVDDDSPSTELYFYETIVDNEGYVEKYIFKFTESGRYRLPMQVGESEDRLKISVRGAGTPPFDGEVTLFFGIR